MKKIIEKRIITIIKKVLLLFKPLIWKIANLYDIRINKHCLGQGQNPLIIDDFENSKKYNIPKSVYFNTSSGKIMIGEGTAFGEDVLVLTGKHLNISEAEEKDLSLHYVPDSGRDIIIGKGCFIGSGAIIIGPCIIGDYAVIGAGSVVTKNVSEKSFVAGIPAKVIKKF